MQAIRDRVAQHPDFAFMSEHITDLYSQFLDCVHGIGTEPSQRGGFVQTGTGVHHVEPQTVMMPELFRYCFPETMITVRNPRPYMEERMVNYAFVYGFKFEMELRYDTDQNFIREDLAPEKRKYAKAVSQLRRRYEDYLLLGKFRSEEEIESANVYANVFEAADGSRVVALWNDRAEAIKPEIVLKGGKAAGWSTIDAEGTGMPEQLPANAVTVLKIE